MILLYDRAFLFGLLFGSIAEALETSRRTFCFPYLVLLTTVLEKSPFGPTAGFSLSTGHAAALRADTMRSHSALHRSGVLAENAAGRLWMEIRSIG